ncbi:SRPBCC family protein [Streptomyces sp. NPDC007205]|uniref:SRPBCC family protein n=1 Tax=Streptomyces sp. NPDC007205 TaxID=3154316 RepID=UPI0033F43340
MITPVSDVDAEVRHELFLSVPTPKLFEVIRDVTCWPELTPVVTAATVIEEESGGRDVVEITMDATRQLRRTIDPDGRTIHFAQINPSEPVVRMEGHWRFEPEGEGTHVVLTHIYTTTTPDALTAIINNQTRSNSTRNLEYLAKHYNETKQ